MQPTALILRPVALQPAWTADEWDTLIGHAIAVKCYRRSARRLAKIGQVGRARCLREVSRLRAAMVVRAAEATLHGVRA